MLRTRTRSWSRIRTRMRRLCAVGIDARVQGRGSERHRRGFFGGDVGRVRQRRERPCVPVLPRLLLAGREFIGVRGLGGQFCEFDVKFDGLRAFDRLRPTRFVVRVFRPGSVFEPAEAERGTVGVEPDAQHRSRLRHIRDPARFDRRFGSARRRRRERGPGAQAGEHGEDEKPPATAGCTDPDARRRHRSAVTRWPGARSGTRSRAPEGPADPVESASQGA